MPDSGTNFLPWTQEEDAELMRLRSTGLSWSQCAEKISARTAKACASRAAALASASKRKGRTAFWTHEEDACLRELWPILPVPEIAERLHRPLKGVCRRADRLGLVCGQKLLKKPWTPEDDSVLKARLGTMTYAEIGVLLDRTEKAVKARAFLLGLRNEPKPQQPKSKPKKNGFMRRCHDCGKPTTDYRCPKCWRKLRAGQSFNEEDDSLNN